MGGCLCLDVEVSVPEVTLHRLKAQESFQRAGQANKVCSTAKNRLVLDNEGSFGWLSTSVPCYK